MSDGKAIWTCSRYFPCCLRPGSFAVEGTDVENAYIKNVDSTYTEDAYAEISYAGGARCVSAVKGLGIYVRSS